MLLLLRVEMPSMQGLLLTMTPQKKLTYFSLNFSPFIKNNKINQVCSYSW
jgi:hypothetical protein